MNWLKKIFGIVKLEEQIESLKGIISIQTQQLKNYRGYANYITTPIPSYESVQQLLSDLNSNKVFQFYLMTQKNEIVILFENNKEKDADLTKGALRLIEKMRDDMSAAATEIGKQNAKV